MFVSYNNGVIKLKSYRVRRSSLHFETTKAFAPYLHFKLWSRLTKQIDKIDKGINKLVKDGKMFFFSFYTSNSHPWQHVIFIWHLKLRQEWCKYRTRTIINRSLYILNPLFESQNRFSRRFLCRQIYLPKSFYQEKPTKFISWFLSARKRQLALLVIVIFFLSLLII